VGGCWWSWTYSFKPSFGQATQLFSGWQANMLCGVPLMSGTALHGTANPTDHSL
jgi:hypothetical protein